MPDLPPSVADILEGDASGLPWPEGFASARRPRVPVEQLVSSHRALTAEDASFATRHMESGASMGTSAPSLKAIRHTHHRLAQLLAGGMDETVAARLCNYNVSRVSILKADPAFRDLLAHYTNEVNAEFADFIRTAADLSMDMLGHLQQMLDETPEKFTPDIALKAIATLADRSGNAPTQKSVNLNINTDVASRLRAADARLKNITPPSVDTQ